MIIDNTINDFRRELLNLGYSKTVVDNYPKYAQKLLEYTKETALKITDQHIKNYYQYLKTKPSRITKKTTSSWRNTYNSKLKHLQNITKNNHLVFDVFYQIFINKKKTQNKLTFEIITRWIWNLKLYTILLTEMKWT